MYFSMLYPMISHFNKCFKQIMNAARILKLSRMNTEKETCFSCGCYKCYFTNSSVYQTNTRYGHTYSGTGHCILTPRISLRFSLAFLSGDKHCPSLLSMIYFGLRLEASYGIQKTDPREWLHDHAVRKIGNRT